MKLSIIIPIRNEASVIAKSLDLIRNNIKEINYEVIAVNDWLNYNVGIGGAIPYIEEDGKIRLEYLDEYGPDNYEFKLVEDAIAVLNNEPIEYRQMVICFARQVARADWSYFDAVGNISYEEFDRLSYFCVKLNV